MGIQGSTFEGQFGNTFGNRSNGNGNSQRERKDAHLWLNVGYQTEVTNADGEAETLFISLPFGIPLDTQDAFDLSKIRNANMVELRSAQNDLLEQIMGVANALEPGEEKLIAIDGKTGLCVQIRRVKDAAAAPAEGENRLAKKLKLVA